MSDKPCNDSASSGDGACPPPDVNVRRLVSTAVEASAAMEPFPIVDFSETSLDRTQPHASSPWTWAVIEYGTNRSSPDAPLRVGDVVTLEEDLQDPVRLVINGQVVADGTLVREDGRIGIRVLRIFERALRSALASQDLIEDAA